MVFVKNGHFSNFFFRQYRPGKRRLRYSRAKNAFVDYKTKSSKNRKIDIFAKGITHGFGPKMAIFPTFLFRQGKCLLRYSTAKKRLSRL